MGWRDGVEGINVCAAGAGVWRGDGVGGGGERKTKAMDINDLPTTRSPRAGGSVGPFNTN